MKPFVNSILITGILAIVATTSMVAQTSNSGFEQWYRAKYGRPSPAGQVDLTQMSSTTPDATQSTVAVTEFEQWYRAKYGRPAPSEKAPLKVQSANSTAPETTLPTVAVSEVGQSAKTPAEHQRLALSYQAEAQNYLAQAKEHAAMVSAYKTNPNINAKNQAATVGHCEYFAAKFNDLAVKSQELARMHEQMARDAERN